MIRLTIVILVAAAVIGLTLGHIYWLAMTIGVAVGAVMFLLGMAAGGGVGNVRRYESKPGDVGARIGLCLAAMGIAIQGLRLGAPYAQSFQAFCQVCQYLGAVIAIILAFRYRHAGKDVRKS
jgi:amino acid permease